MVSKAEVEQFEQTWSLLFSDIEKPSQYQLARWLLTNTADDVDFALKILINKHNSLGGTMTSPHAHRFMSSVLNRLRREAGEAKLT